MLLGALVDAGVDAQLLEETAAGLGLGAELVFERVERCGIRGTRARVLVGGRDADGGLSEGEKNQRHSHGHIHTHTHAPGAGDEHGHAHPGHGHTHVHGRGLPEIRALIAGAALSSAARKVALDAFERLGAAEAKMHGVPVEEVHFHEVGAVDAIVDIVCAAVGAEALGVSAWYGSAVNTGSGFVECAHGLLPVPAPATVELLRGVPVYASGPAKEMTTPTGAALLRALACRFAEPPVFCGESTGYGAGTRDPAGFANVLRLRTGRLAADAGQDRVTVLECAIDDASAEVLAYAAARLMEAGALDAMQQAVGMKKGRHGTLLTVLCRPADAGRLEAMLFAETTTLGVRRREEARTVLARRLVTVETRYGAVGVKYAGENAAPEFEDCRRAAERHGVALKEVMLAALVAAAAGPSPAATRSGGA